MRKEELFNVIKNKKVIIWGLGEKGKQFYNKYINRLNIVYGTSNGMDTFEAIERIEPKDALNVGNAFIVICSAYEEEISFQLMKNEKRWGTDFMSADWLDAVFSQKKIVLSVGQCELNVTNFIFKELSELKENYFFDYYDEYKVLGIEEKKPILQIAIKVNCIIEMADYFIYPANLSKDRLDYYNDLLLRTSIECKTASVPLTTFEGYWPQDLSPYYEKHPMYLADSSGKYPFGGRRDNNIEKMFLSKSREEILSELHDIQYYSEEMIKKNFSKSFKKYRLIERKSNIRISDFLIENYRNRPIFRDRGHASGFVLKEYAVRILDFFDISVNDEYIENVNLAWYDDCHGEFPIYPCVMKMLDFKMENYLLIGTKGKQKMRFEQYIMVMIDYFKNIDKIWKSI